jgi:hypothetical protein
MIAATLAAAKQSQASDRIAAAMEGMRAEQVPLSEKGRAA